MSAKNNDRALGQRMMHKNRLLLHDDPLLHVLIAYSQALIQSVESETGLTRFRALMFIVIYLVSQVWKSEPFKNILVEGQHYVIIRLGKSTRFPFVQKSKRFVNSETQFHLFSKMQIIFAFSPTTVDTDDEWYKRPTPAPSVLSGSEINTIET